MSDADNQEMLVLLKHIADELSQIKSLLKADSRLRSTRLEDIQKSVRSLLPKLER